MKTMDKTSVLNVASGFINLPCNPKEERDSYV
jgi:hypothetical protein